MIIENKCFFILLPKIKKAPLSPYNFENNMKCCLAIEKSKWFSVAYHCELLFKLYLSLWTISLLDVSYTQIPTVAQNHDFTPLSCTAAWSTPLCEEHDCAVHFNPHARERESNNNSKEPVLSSLFPPTFYAKRHIAEQILYRSKYCEDTWKSFLWKN